MADETAPTLTDAGWLADLSATIREYLVANDVTSRAGFHATALTHHLAARLAAERARTAEVLADPETQRRLTGALQLHMPQADGRCGFCWGHPEGTGHIADAVLAFLGKLLESTVPARSEAAPDADAVAAALAPVERLADTHREVSESMTALWQVERERADRLEALCDRLAERLAVLPDLWREEGRSVMFNRDGGDLTPQGRVGKWLNDKTKVIDSRAALAEGKGGEHKHVWTRKQNVTTSGYQMPAYEVCVCGAAREAGERHG